MKNNPILYIVVIWLLFDMNGVLGQEPIVSGVPFTNIWSHDYKIIPAFRQGDSLIIAYSSTERQSVGYAANQAIFPYYWEINQFVTTDWPFPDQAEFICGNHGERYFYDGYDDFGYLWYISDSTNQPQFRLCPDRPVIDNYGNLHIIWQDNSGVYYYGMSADTLRTFLVLDTLTGLSGFRRIAVSPDNSIIAAIFIQDSNMIKYFSGQDGPMNFDAPVTIPCPSDVYQNTSFLDMTLDYVGDIYVVYNGGGNGQWEWGFHFAWTEGYNPVFLDSAYDDIVNGTYFEIFFSQNRQNVIIAENDGQGFYQCFFVSSDNGTSWWRSRFNFQPESRPLLCSPRSYSDYVDFFYYQSDYLYHESVPHFLISQNLAIKNDQLNIPISFDLFAYPNPFNAQTTLSFTLAQAGQASIAIYDIAGRLVETIAEREFPAGENRVIWDAFDKPSGVYFVRVNAAKSQSIGKLLLLK